MKTQRLLFEAVFADLLLLVVALDGPAQALLDGHVEQNGQIGCQPLGRHAVKRVDQRQVQAAPLSLVGDGGVGEAVA